MSALGQKPTCALQNDMSAIPPKADIRPALFDHLVRPGGERQRASAAFSVVALPRRSETADSLEPVAERVGGWPARRVVAGAALNQIGLIGVAEEDEGGTIVGGLAVTGDLPSFLQHGADRRRVLGRGRGVNRQCE